MQIDEAYEFVGPSRHRWRRIDYEDDVVPWHCMDCGTYDTDDWDGQCGSGNGAAAETSGS